MFLLSQPHCRRESAGRVTPPGSQHYISRQPVELVRPELDVITAAEGQASLLQLYCIRPAFLPVMRIERPESAFSHLAAIRSQPPHFSWLAARDYG